MNGYTRTSILLAGLVALSGVRAPAPLAGQDRDSVPIFLALPETFPDLDARAVLMREPGRDVVILDPEGADPETLSVALGLLRRLRREGAVADRAQLVPITGFAARGEFSPERSRRLERALSELRARPLANVGNLGPGRWMRLRDR
jgi:hypothetical protein